MGCSIDGVLMLRFLSSHARWHQAVDIIKTSKPTVMAFSEISQLTEVV